MKSLCVAVLSAFLVLGVSASVIAQQTGASSSAESQATKPADDKATSSSSSSSSAVKDESPSGASARTETPPAVPAPDRSSSSSSTSIDVKADTGKGDIGSASPRTGGESRRIFGLEPTAALLIGAAILLVVVLALVAMARGGETSSHTDVDLRR
jgi:hypothetical protein